jgi:hypothetical protein
LRKEEKMLDNAAMNLDARIKSLEGKSDNDLLAIMGAYSLSENTDRLFMARAESFGWDDFVSHGRAFFKKVEPVLKEAICGNDGLMAMADSTTVKTLVPIVLTALAIPAGWVPTVVVAIAYMVIRAGIRVYCKGYSKPKTAST